MVSSFGPSYTLRLFKTYGNNEHAVFNTNSHSICLQLLNLEYLLLSLCTMYLCDTWILPVSDVPDVWLYRRVSTYICVLNAKRITQIDGAGLEFWPQKWLKNEFQQFRLKLNIWVVLERMLSPLPSSQTSIQHLKMISHGFRCKKELIHTLPSRVDKKTWW